MTCAWLLWRHSAALQVHLQGPLCTISTAEVQLRAAICIKPVGFTHQQWNWATASARAPMNTS